MNKTTFYPAFFTATNHKWQHLLSPAIHKQIILDSLLFMKNDERVIIYAFVIMPNHIHLIWQPVNDYLPNKNQHCFLKFTAQQIKFAILKYRKDVLIRYAVNAADRQYQFWKRNSLSIALYSEKVFLQKLGYIHRNPVKAGFCRNPEEYPFSSARFYETGVDEWGFLSHYRG